MVERFSFPGTELLRFLDADEVANLPEHTGEHRALLVLGRAPDLAEAERAQRAAVPLALADLAADLGDADLRHGSSRPSSSGARGPGRGRHRPTPSPFRRRSRPRPSRSR